MVEIQLDYTKNAFENAAMFFDKAKKAKSKIAGAQEAIAKATKELEKLQKQKAIIIAANAAKKPPRKKEWFEKFRWCYTPSGLLAIGGRDATTNEILIKKHLEPNDLVFHTEMAGSPFFAIKSGTQKPTKEDMDCVAQMCGVYSRAWQNSFTTANVFCVKPDQVSKNPNQGEYISKGAFIVRGDREQFMPTLELALGIENYNDGNSDQVRIIAGPIPLIKKKSPKSVTIKLGHSKPSEIAKIIKKELKFDDVDEIIRMLPTGGCRIGK